MIVNRYGVPTVGHSGLKILHKSDITDCHDWEDYNYFIFEFITTELITKEIIDTVFTQDIRKSIRQGKLKLILGNKYESFHFIIKDCYEIFCLNLGFDPKDIILISASNTIYDSVKKISKAYNLSEFKTAVYRWAEKKIAFNELTRVKSKPVNKHNRNFEKKFILLNRRWRPHRPALVGLLGIRGLLDKGYVSLKSEEIPLENWELAHHRVSEIITNQEFLYEWHTNKSAIVNIPDLTVDIKHFEGKDTINFDKNLQVYYANTYFSIVSETSFFTPDDLMIQNHTQFSEKTFKDMSQRQPFIMMNNFDSLKYLKEYGYKTFHPYINESYDQERDDGKRLLMIRDEVQRLCELNNDDLTEFLIETEKICEHNYQFLVSNWYKKDRFIQFQN